LVDLTKGEKLLQNPTFIPIILEPQESYTVYVTFKRPEHAEQYIESKLTLWDPVQNKKFGDLMCALILVKQDSDEE
jgi:hypothetical protein